MPMRHEDADFPEEAKRLYPSIKGYKSALTLRRKELLNIEEAARKTPSREGKDCVKNALSRYQEALRKYGDAVIAVAQADDSKYDDWIAGRDEYLNQIRDEEIQAEAVRVMGVLEDALKPKEQTVTTGETLVKVDQQTRPNVLHHQSKSITFAQWRKVARRYWINTALEKKSILTQYATLETLLDKELLSQIEMDAIKDGERLIVFAADDANEPRRGLEKAKSVMTVLENYFLKKEPLNKRRLAFRTQPPIRSGQGAVTLWLAEQVVRAQDARLKEGLTYDEIMVEHILYFVKDGRLKDELYKLEEPTFDSMREAIAKWEKRHEYKDHGSIKESHHIRSLQIKAYATGTKKGTYKKRNKSEGRSKSRRRDDGRGRNRCFACGEEYNPRDPRGHDPKSCYALKMTCRRCGGRSHVQKACGLQAERKKRSNSIGARYNSSIRGRTGDVKRGPNARSRSRPPPQAQKPKENSNGNKIALLAEEGEEEPLTHYWLSPEPVKMGKLKIPNINIKKKVGILKRWKSVDVKNDVKYVKSGNDLARKLARSFEQTR